MAGQLKPPVSETDHIQGDSSAAIEIVEYGDFQCPHCGAAHPILKKIQQLFGSQIRFVFRNFPLAESHPYATIAAIAAEAAGLQNKYWSMHDLIFEYQQQLDEDFLYQLAAKLKLDTDKFELDLQSKALQDKVDADFESGMRSGVNGTPTFFVNGQKFDGGATDLLDMLKESAT